MTKHIPNFITLMNLFFGSLAIWATFNGQYYLVPGLFWAAILCDYADGMAARMLKVHSDMGKELDSLADMVGFGLLPGVIYFKLIAEVAGLPSNEINTALPLWPLPFLGFIITLFSALRLAKFNLDTRQTDGFLGLATPSSTAFAVGLLLIYQHDPSLSWLFNVPTLLGLCIGMSLLLVSELPMLGLKFKHFRWEGNALKYIAILVLILGLSTLGAYAFSVLVLFYILFSLGVYLWQKRAS